MMYLMLSVAGHLTIFLTRTRGPFWSITPAPALWIACLGTQILATCIAVFGFLMPPLDWRWAAAVWGYALIWALLSDQVKLLAYRFFDSPKAAEAAKAKGIAQRAEAEAKPGLKSSPASAAKAEAKPDLNAAPGPGAKAAVKPDAKAAPAPDVKAERPHVKSVPVPEAGKDAEVDSKTATASEAKAEAQTDAKSKTPTDLTPKLIERVHALYEELGRQDVLAVQELEQAAKTSKEAAP
jgi:H+-transporting ATPase